MLWSPSTQEERDAFYRGIEERESPFHKELLSNFRDPTGNDQQAVGISIDSKKFKTLNSMDYEAQKDAYYSKKGGHFFTATTLVDTTGYVVGTLPLGAAASPRCGDSQLTGLELKIEEEDCFTSGIKPILRGSNSHFVVLAVDKGYVFVPHNVDLANIENVKEWCQQNGCFIVWPSSDDDDIVQVRNDKFVMVNSTGCPILTQNSRAIVTCIC